MAFGLTSTKFTNSIVSVITWTLLPFSLSYAHTHTQMQGKQAEATTLLHVKASIQTHSPVCVQYILKMACSVRFWSLLCLQAIQRIFQILGEPVLFSFSKASASSKSGLSTTGCGSSPWQLCSIRAKNNLKRPADGSYEKQSPNAL